MAKEAKLELYIWSGSNTKGEKLSGEVSATSLALAKAEIRRQGIIIQSVKKKPINLFSGGKGKKVTAADIAIILRQLATMLSAGIAVVQSLDMIAQAQANPNGKKMVFAIKADIEGGTPFSKALRKYPENFNALTCNLLDAGERSGSLDKMLGRVASYAEKTESLKKKIKKALTYPAAVIGIAILITIGLLIKVVPVFKDVYTGFGAQLPGPTLVVIAMSDYVRKYWWIVIGGLIAGIMGLIRAYKQSLNFQEKIDRWSLKLPILGVILEKAAIARFARTLSTTFAAGLPLVDALESVSGATGNIVFSKATLKIRDEVSTGQKIQKAMNESHLFPPLVVQMVGIGEESGSLEFMLEKVASFYEEDVDNAVDNLSALLEPLIMVVLGTLIGGLVVAMYLPIFKLGSVIH